MTAADLHIAFFITAHGFGHAARAVAVMAAIRRIRPRVRLSAYTTVPAWFFDDPEIRPVTVRCLETDVGMVQETPLVEDPARTLQRLNAFFPAADSYLRGLADEMTSRGVSFVVADIAPVGIAAAAVAGIPSVLVENFTWDWIYAPYQQRWPGFEPHIRHLAGLFGQADVHIQAEPVCNPVDCHLTVAPVGRKARTPAAETRARLGIPDGERMVLLTLGGTPLPERTLSGLTVAAGCHLVVPGGPAAMGAIPGVLRLEFNSGFYHPDLIAAADAVIGKAGYSTLAEIYRCGVPFGFVSRPSFREAPLMEAFIRGHMAGCQVPETVFHSGNFADIMTVLAAMARAVPAGENGADTIARFLLARLGGGAGLGVSGG